MISEVKKMLRVLGSFRKYVFLLLLRAPFDSLHTALHAAFLMNAFGAVEAGDSSRLISTCLLFGAGSCMLFLYNGSVWRLFGTAYVKLGGRLRRVLLQAVIRQPLSVIEEKTYGDVLTRMNQDANMALQFLGGPLNLPHFVVALVNVIVSSVILCGLDVRMLFLVWLFVLPHILINNRVIHKPVTRYQREVQEAAGAASAMLGAMIQSADTAILYDAQEYLLQEYENRSRSIMKAGMKIVKRSTMGSALIPLFGLGGYLALMMLGVNRIAEGTFHFGDLTAVFQYRGGIFTGAMMLMTSVANMKRNVSGVGRVNELIPARVNTPQLAEGYLTCMEREDETDE